MEIERGTSRRREEGRAAEGLPGWGDQRGSLAVTLVVLQPQQVLSPDMLKEWVSHTAHLTQKRLTEISEVRILSLRCLVLISGLAGLLMWGFKRSECSVGEHVGLAHAEIILNMWLFLLKFNHITNSQVHADWQSRFNFNKWNLEHLRNSCEENLLKGWKLESD